MDVLEDAARVFAAARDALAPTAAAARATCDDARRACDDASARLRETTTRASSSSSSSSSDGALDATADATLSLARALAERATSPAPDVLFAVVAGTHLELSRAADALHRCDATREDPSTVSHRVATACASRVVRRAPALVAIAASRVREIPGDETRRASCARAMTERCAVFARRHHAAYRAFREAVPARWRDGLDGSAVAPALSRPFAATLACAHEVSKDVERAIATSAEDGTSTDAAADGAALAETLANVVDALAHLEFARSPNPAYADVLRVVASSLGGDDALGVGCEASRRFMSTRMWPDARAELDARRGAGGGGVAWRDDPVLSTRTHLLLRLVPYARLPGGVGGGGGGAINNGNNGNNGNGQREGVTGGELPIAVAACMTRCLRHPRATVTRSSHVAFASAFKRSPRAAEAHFPTYLTTALEAMPYEGATSTAMSDATSPRAPAATPTTHFIAAVGAATRGCLPGSSLPTFAARRCAARAAELDAATSDATSDAAATLRRLVFNLLSIVDHEHVEPLRAEAERALLRRVPSRTGPRTTASAWCTSILKDFSRRFSPPAPRFQSQHTSTPFNSASDAFERHPDVASYGTTLSAGGGDRAARLRAYDDLVAGIGTCGDYARKNASVAWALRLRSRL